MLSPETIADARRQFEICNACRYCEGVCPVFPALERRTQFDEPDVLFLANLCHDCQTCYHVCPFTPPHAFAVNIPLLMTGIRETTYRRAAWPSILGTMLERPGVSLGIAVGGGFALALGVAFANTGLAGLTQPQVGAGAFYRVIPYVWMFAPAMILSIWAIVAAIIGLIRFSRLTGQSNVGRDAPARFGGAALRAIVDAFTLKHLRGGGPGCDYPHEIPSPARRRFHGLVFWGFIAAFASTTIAFFKQEFGGELPPYPLLSEPVILGTGGGIAMTLGALGLLRLKAVRRRETSRPSMVGLDRAFLWSVIGVNVTGLGLLALRDTAALVVLLTLHLALVGAFFLTAPYSKFVHFVYRIAALVQDQREQRHEGLHAHK